MEEEEGQGWGGAVIILFTRGCWPAVAWNVNWFGCRHDLQPSGGDTFLHRPHLPPTLPPPHVFVLLLHLYVWKKLKSICGHLINHQRNKILLSPLTFEIVSLTSAQIFTCFVKLKHFPNPPENFTDLKGRECPRATLKTTLFIPSVRSILLYWSRFTPKSKLSQVCVRIYFVCDKA